MNLNHLHLHVRSRDASQRFYETHFGFSEWTTHGDILFLRDEAGLDLALAPAADAGEPPGWFHFGFRLPRAAEVEQLHRRLAGEGVRMRGPMIQDVDLVSFRCFDPDGYGIEVYWEPEPAVGAA